MNPVLILVVVGFSASASAALVGSAPLLASSSRANVRLPLRMSADDSPASHIKVELIAQGGAVGGLTRTSHQQQQQAEVVSSPAARKVWSPREMNNLVSMETSLKAGLVVGTVVAIWQSKKLYTKRTNRLLASFSASMLAYLGDETEMKSAINTFRRKLGPGSFRTKMFESFTLKLITGKNLDANTVVGYKKTIDLMKLSDRQVTEVFQKVSSELKTKSAMLTKLTFLAERTAPKAAKKAELRTKNEKFSEATVNLLQTAFQEGVYKTMSAALPEDAEPPPGGDVLGLSEDDCVRLFAKAHEEKRAKKEARAAEKARAAAILREIEAEEEEKNKTRKPKNVWGAGTE